MLLRTKQAGGCTNAYSIHLGSGTVSSEQLGAALQSWASDSEGKT